MRTKKPKLKANTSITWYAFGESVDGCVKWKFQTPLRLSNELMDQLKERANSRGYPLVIMRSKMVIERVETIGRINIA